MVCGSVYAARNSKTTFPFPSQNGLGGVIGNWSRREPPRPIRSDKALPLFCHSHSHGVITAARHRVHCAPWTDQTPPSPLLTPAHACRTCSPPAAAGDRQHVVTTVVCAPPGASERTRAPANCSSNSLCSLGTISSCSLLSATASPVTNSV